MIENEDFRRFMRLVLNTKVLSSRTLYEVGDEVRIIDERNARKLGLKFNKTYIVAEIVFLNPKRFSHPQGLLFDDVRIEKTVSAHPMQSDSRLKGRKVIGGGFFCPVY